MAGNIFTIATIMEGMAISACHVASYMLLCIDIAMLLSVLILK